MEPPLALLTLVLAGLVPGWLWLDVLAAGRAPSPRELARPFAALMLGLLAVGWLALVLAEFGQFSLLLLALLWLALVAIGAGLRLRSPRATEASPEEPAAAESSPVPAGPWSFLSRPPRWLEYALLAAWLAAALWLFFRPHEYITGAADAGVYVNLAANIAQTGAIVYHDPAVAALDPAARDVFLRPLPLEARESEIAPAYLFPGFYVTDAAAGQITPQFYPLHPVWQAVAFALGGVRAALLMTGLWAALGGLAVYLAAREAGGWPAAPLALAGLSANALMIWFARYPVTEALTLCLLWTGMWALMLMLRSGEPPRLWGLLAALAWGSLLLTRIDAYLLLVVPFGLYLGLRWSGRWRPGHAWFFAPLALLAAHSLLHAWLQSRPYFVNLFGYALLLLGRGWPVVLGLLAALAAVLFWLGRHRDWLALLGRRRRGLALAAMAAVVLLAAYGWFIRPALGGPEATYADWYSGAAIPLSLDRDNLVRLGWYLSPLTVALAIAGICLLIWQADRRRLLLLAVGLLFSLVYLWRLQANPHQIYAMRRYVPAVMPFAIVAAAFGLGWLVRRGRWWRYAGLALAGLWLALLGWSARGFVSQLDHRGLIAQYEALNARLDPGAVLLFDDQAPITVGDVVGTPLHFLYGHDAFSLRRPEAAAGGVLTAAASAWAAAGRTVYWVGDPGRPAAFGLEAGLSWSATLSDRQLEGRYDRKPVDIVVTEHQLTFTPVKPAAAVR